MQDRNSSEMLWTVHEQFYTLERHGPELPPEQHSPWLAEAG